MRKSLRIAGLLLVVATLVLASAAFAFGAPPDPVLDPHVIQTNQGAVLSWTDPTTGVPATSVTVVSREGETIVNTTVLPSSATTSPAFPRLLFPGSTYSWDITRIAADDESTTTTYTFYPPPIVIDATVSPAPNASGWNNESVAVSCTVNPPFGDPNVGTWYSIGLAPWDSDVVLIPYNGPFTYSAEGTTTIYYFGEGGWSQTRWDSAIDVKIDKTPPTTNDDHLPNYVGTATIHLVANDNLSGVASSKWTLDATDGNGTLVSTSVVGNHTLQYWSIDKAGNFEAVHTVNFTVIAATPTVHATATSLSGAKTARRKKTYKVCGTVTPAPTPNGRTLRLVVTRLVGKKWKSYASVTLQVTGGKFSYSFKPRYKGKYRLQASFLGCSTSTDVYSSSKSAVKSLTVK